RAPAAATTRSRASPAATPGQTPGPGSGAVVGWAGAGEGEGAGAGTVGEVAVRGWRDGRPRPMRVRRRESVERNQPPLVVASRTRWPGAMKVRGPPAAYGQTDGRTLSSVPAPFGNVHGIVKRGP